jgi:hypothetical protein
MSDFETAEGIYLREELRLFKGMGQEKDEKTAEIRRMKNVIRS